MIEKKFIKEAKKRLKASEYVKNELKKAGIVEVKIQRTTLSTRIGISAERPGIVIGRKGQGIRGLSEAMEKDLGIENPQIEISDVGQSSLEPLVIARWISRMLEKGMKPKKVAQRAADRVMESGAMGVEIVLKGTPSKGAKARKERILVGYMKKAGDSVKNVRKARAQALLKQGVIGIDVNIVPRDVVFPDKVDVKEFADRLREKEEPKEEEAPKEDLEKKAEVKVKKVKKTKKKKTEKKEEEKTEKSEEKKQVEEPKKEEKVEEAPKEVEENKEGE